MSACDGGVSGGSAGFGGAPVKMQPVKIGKVIISLVPHPEGPDKWRLGYFDWYIGGGPMYTRDKLTPR